MNQYQKERLESIRNNFGNVVMIKQITATLFLVVFRDERSMMYRIDKLGSISQPKTKTVFDSPGGWSK
jgi:hypothetical protein